MVVLFMDGVGREFACREVPIVLGAAIPWISVVEFVQRDLVLSL